MEEKEKEILDRNYHLLVHNIILTEEFYNQLRWNQVLPDSMIDDIQVCLVRKKSRHGQKHIKFKFKIKKYVISIYSFVSYILYIIPGADPGGWGASRPTLKLEKN